MSIKLNADVFFDPGDKPQLKGGKSTEKKNGQLSERLSKYSNSEGSQGSTELRCHHCEDFDRRAGEWNEVFSDLPENKRPRLFAIGIRDANGKITHFVTKDDTDLPGEHERDDFVAPGYRNVIVNDNNGNTVSRTIKTPDGKVVRRIETTHITVDGKPKQVQTIYDANSRKTGTYTMSLNPDGSYSSIEYRNANGKLLCTEKNGKFYDAKGNEISAEKAQKLINKIFPQDKENKKYDEIVSNCIREKNKNFNTKI